MARSDLLSFCWLLVLGLLHLQIGCVEAQVPAPELEDLEGTFVASPAAERFFWSDGNADAQKNCLTKWKCPEETPYCMKSTKVEIAGVCVECIKTDSCKGNLLCSGISHDCLLPPLLLFNIKYEGASPPDFIESMDARVCSNILSLVSGLKGTCKIQEILPGSAITFGYIIGEDTLSGDSYEAVLENLRQLADIMNAPLNSNLNKALSEGLPGESSTAYAIAKVLTSYDPNNIPQLPEVESQPDSINIVLESDDTLLFFEKKGDKAQLEVSVTDSSGSTLAIPVFYRSLNPEFINVTQDGMVEVTGDGLGSAAIEVVAGGAKLVLVPFVASYDANTTIIRNQDVVSFDRSIGEVRLQNTSRTADIVEGSIIWSGAEFGIIGKVASVQALADILILKINEATWFDAVEEIDINVTFSLGVGDGETRATGILSVLSEIPCESSDGVKISIPFPYSIESLPQLKGELIIRKLFFIPIPKASFRLHGEFAQIFGFKDPLKLAAGVKLECSISEDFVVPIPYLAQFQASLKAVGINLGPVLEVGGVFEAAVTGGVTIPLPKLEVTVPIDVTQEFTIPPLFIPSLPTIASPTEVRDVDVDFDWAGKFAGFGKTEVSLKKEATLKLKASAGKKDSLWGCDIPLIGFSKGVGLEIEEVFPLLEPFSVSSINYTGPKWDLKYSETVKALGITCSIIPGVTAEVKPLLDDYPLAELVLAESPKLKISSTDLSLEPGELVAIDAEADFPNVRDDNILCDIFPAVFCPRFTNEYQVRIAESPDEVAEILTTGQFENSNRPTTFVDETNVQISEPGEYLLQIFVQDTVFKYGSEPLQVSVSDATTMPAELIISPPSVSDGEVDKQYDFTFEVRNVPMDINSLEFIWSFGTSFGPVTGRETVTVVSGTATLLTSISYQEPGSYSLNVLATDEFIAVPSLIRLEKESSISIGTKVVEEYDLTICDTWQAADSGGQGVTFGTWNVASIPPGALFDIRFQAFDLPDKFIVEYPAGNTVVNTGWRGSSLFGDGPAYPGGLSGPGSGEILGFAARETGQISFDVIVYGVDPDTEWEYDIRCRIPDGVNPLCDPGRPTPQCTYCCGAPNPNSCQDCGFTGYDDCVARTTCDQNDPYLEPYGGTKEAYCACVCGGQGCPS